jgi:hypothetical protein
VLDERSISGVDAIHGRGVMRVGDREGPGRRIPRQRLAADLHASAHLGDAHQVLE